MAAPDMPRVLVDGEAAGTLPVDDRGFACGDAVFRTVRVDAGRRWLWMEHLEVLAGDCARIGIEFDETRRRAVESDAAAMVARDDGILRITVTRGSGPRGYAPPRQSRPRIILSFVPNAAPALTREPVALRLCRTPLAWSPALAGIKHTGRLEQVLAAAELVDTDVFDGLMLDPEGRPVCGTRCNLFVRRGRSLLTPALERCGVAGVVRAQVLAHRIPGLGDLVDGTRAADLTLADLEEADEVFLTNAVFAVRAVGALQDADGASRMHWSAPGPAAECMIAAYAPLLGD